jgi:peptidoglycan/LPS O-acetylase OafA/YrhL
MRTAASRRAAVASLPSLIGIAAAFFLPFVKGCETMISPLQFSLDSLHKPLALAWVLPRFGVAALLAGWTLYFVVRKREPDRVRLAALALVASAAALATDWWLLLKEEGHIPFWWFAAMSVATLGSAWLIVSAWRSRSWARWERIIAAHAVLSSPLCGVVITAGSWKAVGAGGYVYVTSIVILLALFALSQLVSE